MAMSQLQPLVFNTLSNNIPFNISPLAGANGMIVAIRVQDLARDNVWFNYDNGVWDQLPEVTVGLGNLYIAASVVNIGGTGDLILRIIDDQGNLLLQKGDTVVGGDSMGGETLPQPMPNRQYGIQILVDP